MDLNKGDVTKIKAGANVELELTTGQTIQGVWSGIEKEEEAIKLKSKEDKPEADMEFGAEIVDKVTVA